MSYETAEQTQTGTLQLSQEQNAPQCGSGKQDLLTIKESSGNTMTPVSIVHYNVL